MKKYEIKAHRFFSILSKPLAALTIFTIISCQNIFTEKKSYKDNNSKARIIVTASATTVSRNAINPTLNLSNFINFKLYASTSDLPENLESLTPIATGTTLDELNDPGVELDAGLWNFALSASLEDVTFSGVNTKFEVTPDSINPISFTLNPDIDGGGLRIKMTFPVNADKVHITLEPAEGGTAVFDEDLTASSSQYPIETSSGKNSILFTRDITDSSERLAPGTYNLIYSFYDSQIDEYLNSCEFTVNIAAGVTTWNIDLCVNHLNEVYTISYEFKYYTYESASSVEHTITESELLAQNASLVLPKKYFRKSSIELPVLNNYSLSADSIFIFAGWYDEDDNFVESWEDIDSASEDLTLYAKWISYKSEGNININNGLLNITANLPEKAYVNEGEVTFGATLISDDTDVSTDTDIIWDGKLLYGGMDVNDYGSYYTFTAPTETTPAKLEITNCLDTAGTYQILVTVQYKGITSCQTFNYAADCFGAKLENINFSNDSGKAAFENQITLAARAGTPVEIIITGEGSDGTDGTDGTLAYIIEKLSALPDKVDLDISGITGITKVAGGVFTGTPDIRKLSLPQSTTELATTALFYCANLEYITLPDTVSIIGMLAFPLARMSKLKKFIVTGNSTKKTCTAALNGTLFITNTYEGDTLTGSKIESSTPQSLSDITNLDFSTGELASVTEIGDYVFSNQETLEEINSFGNVKTIGMSTFSECTNLTSIDLSGITSIQKNAFNKTGLTAVTLPATITTLADGVFYECKNLTSVTIDAKIASSITKSVFDRSDSITQFLISGSPDDGQTIKYTTLSNGALLIKEAPDDNIPGNTIKSVVCMAGAADITAIDFSASGLSDITVIEPYAFSLDPNDEEHLSSNFTTITSFGNITTLGENAFENSTLTTISDFGNLKDISYYAFAYSRLTTIPPFTDGMSIATYPFNYTNIDCYQFDSYNISADNNSLQTRDDINTQLIINFNIDYADAPEGVEFLSPNGGGPVLSGIKNATELVINKQSYLPDLTYVYDEDYPEESYISSDFSNHKVMVFRNIAYSVQSITFTNDGNNAHGSIIGDFQFCSVGGYGEFTFANLQTVDLSGVAAIGAYAFYRPEEFVQNDFEITLPDNTNWYCTTDKSEWETWVENYRNKVAQTIDSSKILTVEAGSTLKDTIKSIIAPSAPPSSTNKKYLFLLPD